MTTSTLPTYSTISLYETQRLAEVKASGCAVLTYQVLCGYSRVGKFFAFPSHETISEALGKAYSLRAIRQAILFLEKHRIIKRKNSGTTRRTKTIHLITRKARHLAEKLFEGNPNRNKSATMESASPSQQSDRKLDQSNQRTGTNQPQKRTMRRTRFFKQKNNAPEWRQKGNFGAFEKAPKKEQSKALAFYESAAAHLALPSKWEKPAKPTNPDQLFEEIKRLPSHYFTSTFTLEAIRSMVF
jgi:hypothetical protein